MDSAKLSGEIRLEHSAKKNEYYAYDNNGFICGTLGCNQEKLQEMINRSNLYVQAVELLKECAFYCVDASALDHCNQAIKVQEFLKTTYAKNWLDDIFKKERIQLLINESPDECPITGCRKCESYIIGDNVVYLTEPAYDAYTLPEYNEEEQAFYRTHYDLDDDNREEYEYLCNLDDLKERQDFNNIKEFYGII